MQLTVRHETRYRYEGAGFAVQRLRLTPRQTRGQRVVRWTIDAPGIDAAARYEDGFGNFVHLVAAETPEPEVTVVASGVVETADTSGVVGATGERVHPAVFLRPTPLTAPSEAIAAMAGGLISGDSLDQLHRLMGEIADRVAYERDATHASTSAAEAFAAGRGVCQDHAHIFIAASRHLGTPARYVTGYLLADGASAASHAWAEAHVPGLGWIGFDPANRLCPTDAYVRLACGFDAGSAAPIAGRRTGGGEERLAVSVDVSQAGGQSQSMSGMVQSQG